MVEPAVYLVRDRDQQVVAAWEIIVERHDPGAQALRQQTHREPLDRHVVEQAQRRADDRIARQPSRPPPPPHGLAALAFARLHQPHVSFHAPCHTFLPAIFCLYA